MNKQTKLYLGVGAAGLVAYWLWKNSKKTVEAPELSNPSGIEFNSKEQEDAFWTAFQKKYMIGGKPQNNDVLNAYPYGKYKYTNGKWEQIPYYIGPM